MATRHTAPPRDPLLRQAAEEQLASMTSSHNPVTPNAELLHELQVHQIELEMQSQTLRQAQLALEESRDRYIELYEFAPVGYLTLNLGGIITEINLTAATLLGMDRNTLLKKSLRTLIATKDQEHWIRFFMGVKKHTDTSTVELRMQRGNSSLFHAQLDCVYDKSQVRISFTDISKRIEAEQVALLLHNQLSQATKMEAVGHLTAGIAHDFNNILGAILGYTDLVGNAVNTRANQHLISRYLDAINKAGLRARDLIQQLLAFSRLTPDLPGDIAPISLVAPIIKEVSSLLRSTFPSSIELNYHMDDPSLRACIRPIALHQIILNLCINARDALGEYGQIQILLGRHHNMALRCTSCQQQYDGEFVRLTVKDTGSGIAENIVSNIFDPFFTTKAVGKGSGMGLAVVHGLVHKQGGHIQVESIRGKGTTIHIMLPLAEPVHLEAHAAATQDTDVSLVGIRLMVVDDEKLMAAMLQEYLGMQGAQVMAFDSPLEALKVFERAPNAVDMVITDETMPALTGMHLAERMLQLRPAMPIILCTGYSERTDPELAKSIGVAAFFYKPLNMNELLHKIVAIVRPKPTAD
jgi:PAS domain S-box-containing protein